MSKEYRISLGSPAFDALVRGGEVTVPMENGTVVKLILQDIGFSIMRGAITRAEAGWDTYKGAKVSPETGEEIS